MEWVAGGGAFPLRSNAPYEFTAVSPAQAGVQWLGGLSNIER